MPSFWSVELALMKSACAGVAVTRLVTTSTPVSSGPRSHVILGTEHPLSGASPCAPWLPVPPPIPSQKVTDECTESYGGARRTTVRGGASFSPFRWGKRHAQHTLF